MKTKLSILLEYYLAIVVLLWLITPIVSAIPFYRASVMVFLFIMWFFLVLLNNRFYLWFWISSNFTIIIFIILFLYIIMGFGSLVYEQVINYLYIIIFVSFLYKI